MTPNTFDKFDALEFSNGMHLQQAPRKGVDTPPKTKMTMEKHPWMKMYLSY